MSFQNLINDYNALSPIDQEKFRKSLNLVLKPQSTKFQKTNLIFSIPAQVGTFNNQKDTFSILKLKSNGGLFDSIDPDISNWKFDGDPTYNSCEAFSSTVNILLKNISHAYIIQEARLFGVYRRYNMWQAQLLSNEIVKAGLINQKGKGVIIYLSEEKDDACCMLYISCSDDGKIKIRINKVHAESDYKSGDGVLLDY